MMPQNLTLNQDRNALPLNVRSTAAFQFQCADPRSKLDLDRTMTDLVGTLLSFLAPFIGIHNGGTKTRSMSIV
jgi:hypothetical protein